MLVKKQKDNILRDSTFGWGIYGKVVKINIFCKEVPSEAQLKVFTEEGEEVCNDMITESNMNIYPVNTITRSYTHQPESTVEAISKGDILVLNEIPADPIIIDEDVFEDYYYCIGGIVFQVTGLKEGEKIDKVKLFFDGEENKR